jgi:hypothetical protein
MKKTTRRRRCVFFKKRQEEEDACVRHVITDLAGTGIGDLELAHRGHSSPSPNLLHG